jgi:hypothetical protein
MTEEFAVSLLAAVDDVTRERSGWSLRIYCDSPVVVGMLLGFLDRARLTRQQELVRTILMSSAFGTVNIVRPHASEVLSAIDRVRQENTTTWSRAAGDYLQSLGVPRDLEIVRDILRIPDPVASDNELLRFLTDWRGRRFMVAMERVGGTPGQRLKRLAPQIDRTAPPLAELVDNHAFSQALVALGQRLPKSSQSNLRDAAAIASIAVLSATAESTQSIVRFYTETIRDSPARSPASSSRLPSIGSSDRRSPASRRGTRRTAPSRGTPRCWSRSGPWRPTWSTPYIAAISTPCRISPWTGCGST